VRIVKFGPGCRFRYSDHNYAIIIIIIIIIIETSETIAESLTKYLSNRARKHEIEELQKRAILATAHVLCKVLT
jgi:hypothetical protein